MKFSKKLWLLLIIIVLPMVGCATSLSKFKLITTGKPSPKTEKKLELGKAPAMTDLSLHKLPKPPPKKAGVDSILVVGDSLSVGIGMAMSKELKKKDGVTVFAKGKVGSGLNSPKFYNWEKHLRSFIHKENPDLVVVLIGGNDAFNGPGSDSWANSFEKKVDNFLRIAAENKVMVYWVGLPIMVKDDFTKKVKVANSVMESTCGAYKNCSYIDTWGLASDYAKLRAKDGIHFTFNGYMLLSRHIINRMSDKVAIGPMAESQGTAPRGVAVRTTLTRPTRPVP